MHWEARWGRNCVYGERNTFILHLSSDPLQVRELSNESLHLSASYPGANAQVGVQSMTWHFYLCLTPSSCTPGLLTSWVVNIFGTIHVLIRIVLGTLVNRRCGDLLLPNTPEHLRDVIDRLCSVLTTLQLPSTKCQLNCCGCHSCLTYTCRHAYIYEVVFDRQ